jgi:hypothetical protein
MTEKRVCSFEGCGRPHYGRDFCKSHHSQFWKGAELKPLSGKALPVNERFWSKVNKTDTCWLWTGELSSDGYGRVRIDGVKVAVHRWAFEDAGGVIPEGMQIDHVCRVRNCVNASHLRPVTNKQNGENTGAKVNNLSCGVRGVTWNKRERCWKVRVVHNRQRYNGGRFSNLADAERAAVELRNRLFTHNDTDRRAS